MRIRIIQAFLRIIVVLFMIGCNNSISEKGYDLYNSDRMNDTFLMCDNDKFYYWYNDKQVELILNMNHINLLIDTVNFDSLSLKTLAASLNCKIHKYSNINNLVKLYFNHNLTSTEYQHTINILKKSNSIKCVLPFFERGDNIEPIGTSDLFYVKLKTDCSYAELKKHTDNVGVTIIKDVPYMPQWYILSMSESIFANAIDASNYLYETGIVNNVDPAFMFCFSPCSVPNDPLYSQLWGLNNSANDAYDINAESAWDISTGSNVIVAVVDKPIQIDHPDLSQNISSIHYDTKTNSFVHPVINCVEDADHGTHVAGTIAAIGNNNYQVIGVAHNSQLMEICNPLDTTTTASAELASGISYARIMGADIINCSWTDKGGQYSNLHSTILENAITYALDHGRNEKGCVVVCASGNYGNNFQSVDYPANFNDDIIAVGAIMPNGNRPSFSGYGDKLDVVAPGAYILSTFPFSSYNSYSGTSMATAHVAGVAALILSKDPNLNREEVSRIIEMTAQKIHQGDGYYYGTYYNRNNGLWNNELGYGLVDAYASALFANTSSSILPNSLGLDMYHNGYSYPGTIYQSLNLNGYSNTVYLSVTSNYFNSNYKYFWRLSTGSLSIWKPFFTYTMGHDAIVTLPYPVNPNTTIQIWCSIYNGNSLIATPCITLNVNP